MVHPTEYRVTFTGDIFWFIKSPHADYRLTPEEGKEAKEVVQLHPNASTDVCMCVCSAQTKTHRRYPPLPSPGGLCRGIFLTTRGYFLSDSSENKDMTLRSHTLEEPICVCAGACLAASPDKKIEKEAACGGNWSYKRFDTASQFLCLMVAVRVEAWLKFGICSSFGTLLNSF